MFSSIYFSFLLFVFVFFHATADYMYVMRDVPEDKRDMEIEHARRTYREGGFSPDKYDIFCIERLWKNDK